MTRARDLANIADGTFTATDLDLSGTLTVSGDANFDSGTLFVDVSANNVGIGTTSFNSANKLEVTGDINTTWASGVSRFIGMRFGDGSLYEMGLVAKELPELQVYAKHASGAPITFLTGATPSERMRIDSSGNVLIGKSAFTYATEGVQFNANTGRIEATASSTYAFNFRRNTTTGIIGYFNYAGTDVGTISTNGTTTAYNTSSDARLKENIADAESASELIDAIQVRQFDWKADGSHQRYGMVAQELLEVAPEAVSQGATEDEMMGVDYSKLVPMLVKEIQSLRARVAQLEGA